MTTSKIKFLYFRDTKSPRVVTVARELHGDIMRISWCINKSSAFHITNRVVWRGDDFKKSVARAITTGRLASGDHIETVLIDGVKKVEQAINTVLATSPKLVSTIIRRDLARRRTERFVLSCIESHSCETCGSVLAPDV